MHAIPSACGGLSLLLGASRCCGACGRQQPAACVWPGARLSQVGLGPRQDCWLQGGEAPAPRAHEACAALAGRACSRAFDYWSSDGPNRIHAHWSGFVGSSRVESSPRSGASPQGTSCWRSVATCREDSLLFGAPLEDSVQVVHRGGLIKQPHDMHQRGQTAEAYTSNAPKL